MADMFVFGLYNGWLVGVAVDTVEEIANETAWMLDHGFKKPRFQEAFTPVDGVVTRREMHDKKTKTGKDMWRFFIGEGDGTGTEHMVIAFDPTAFKRGDEVTVSMGQYGKEAKRRGGDDWDDGTAGYAPATTDDIPF